MVLNLLDTILATMRATAESLFTDTCTIEVGADAVGEMGEVLSDQYVLVASSVACRVITQRAPGDTPQRVGEREVIIGSTRIVCPYGTALAVNQRITLDSDDSAWQVVDVRSPLTSLVDTQAVVVRVYG